MLHGRGVGSPIPEAVESHLACPNQVSEGSAFFRTVTSIPNEFRNPETDWPAS